MRPRPELIGCYWTLAGHYIFGPHDESPFDFRDRVQAASSAGYTGIGLKTADLRRILARHSYAEIAQILADHGLRHIELEVVMGWFETGPARRDSNAERLLLLDAAAALNARHVKCPRTPRRHKCMTSSKSSPPRPRKPAPAWRWSRSSSPTSPASPRRAPSSARTAQAAA
jgi:sugar phosphate isomerase/epimerase